MAKLPPRQQRFVDEYLVDLNATQAAIRAGYSVKNADKIGSELLGKTRVSDAKGRAMAERSRRTGVTADRVVRELARIGFANIGKIVDESNGDLLPNLSDDDLAAISSIKTRVLQSAGGVEVLEREIKFHDKGKALELLAKHLGMLTDNVNLQHNFVGDFEIVVGAPDEKADD